MRIQDHSKNEIKIPVGFRSLPRREIMRVLRQIANSDVPGNGWYKRRKVAAKEISDLSGGDLILASNYYRSDSDRHWLTHIKCSHDFRLSMTELRNEGPQFVCPYCNRPEMDRFGTVDDLFNHVQTISEGKTLFIKNQEIASPESWYAFYCMECREAFHLDFLSFRNGAGIAGHNACPTCRANKS
jgi:hypothetical protein